MRLELSAAHAVVAGRAIQAGLAVRQDGPAKEACLHIADQLISSGSKVIILTKTDPVPDSNSSRRRAEWKARNPSGSA